MRSRGISSAWLHLVVLVVGGCSPSSTPMSCAEQREQAPAAPVVEKAPEPAPPSTPSAPAPPAPPAPSAEAPCAAPSAEERSTGFIAHALKHVWISEPYQWGPGWLDRQKRDTDGATTLLVLDPNGTLWLLDAWIDVRGPRWRIRPDEGFRFWRGCWRTSEPASRKLAATLRVVREERFHSTGRSFTGELSPVLTLESATSLSFQEARFRVPPEVHERAARVLLYELSMARGEVFAQTSEAPQTEADSLNAVALALDWKGTQAELRTALLDWLGIHGQDEDAATIGRSLGRTAALLAHLRVDALGPVRRIRLLDDSEGEDPMLRTERTVDDRCEDATWTIDRNNLRAGHLLRIESLALAGSSCCQGEACEHVDPRSALYAWLRADAGAKREVFSERGLLVTAAAGYFHAQDGRACVPAEAHHKPVVLRRTTSPQQVAQRTPGYSLEDLVGASCDFEWDADGSARCLVRAHMDDSCFVLRRASGRAVIERIDWYDWTH